MKLKVLKPRNHKKVAKIFWLLFPFMGFWFLWKFFKFVLNFGHFYEIKHKRSLFGLAAFTSLFFLNKKYFFIRYLAVSPNGRGKGVGSIVLKQLEEKAKAKKHNFVFLFSAPWRNGAHNFYLKNGFKKVFGVLFWKKLK